VRELLGDFGGGVVRVEASTSATLNGLYPYATHAHLHAFTQLFTHSRNCSRKYASTHPIYAHTDDEFA
jgi:hypothetical protein